MLRMSKKHPVTLTHEPVAYTMHGVKMHGVARIVLQFPSQAKYVCIHRPCCGIAAVTPNLVEQFASRDDTFFVIKQKAKNLEFLRGDRYILTGTAHLHREKVDLDVIELKYFTFVASLPQSANRCPHACNHLTRTEWLGNIVIRPQLQHHHLIYLINHCAQYNDGQVGSGTFHF